MIFLNSVGSGIDPKTLIVYPALETGSVKDVAFSITSTNGVHLADCSSEWFSSLSDDDSIIIRNMFHVNCRGCHKPDTDTLIGKLDECHMCDGSGEIYEYIDGVPHLEGYCNMCDGQGEFEYIPKVSEHHWARVDAYGIYTGIYCDKCYKSNYPYKKGRYHDPSYCGEEM